MTNYSVEQYVKSAAARRESYDALAVTALEILESVRNVLTLADDLQIPGWRIKRIPIDEYNIELALCESTAPNIPFEVKGGEALDALIVVKRGKLHVTFSDALGGFDLEPGRVAFLPGGVQRTTLAADHPTTLFAVIYGRREHEQSNAATLRRRLDGRQNYPTE